MRNRDDLRTEYGGPAGGPPVGASIFEQHYFSGVADAAGLGDDAAANPWQGVGIRKTGSEDTPAGDGLFGLGGLGDLPSAVAAGIQAAGEGAKAAGQGIGSGAGAAGQGVGSAAGAAGQGISSAAGGVADSAATAAKWAIGLAIGIPVVGGLALATVFVLLAREGQKTVRAVVPSLVEQAPAILPFAASFIAPAQGAARFASQAQQFGRPDYYQRPLEANLLPPRRIDSGGGWSGNTFSAKKTLISG